MKSKVSLIALLAALVIVPTANAATPAVKTGPASYVGPGSAIIAGIVNPENAATSWYFQFGTSTSYGLQTAPQTIGAGTKGVNVASPLTGLQAGTKYHYRLIALNSSGATTGADATFTTATIPLSLSLTTNSNPTPYGAPVILTGTLNGTNNAGRAIELLANPFPYLPVAPATLAFQVVGNAELTSSSGAFSFPLATAPTVTTQYEVVTVGAPSVTSAVLTLGVAPAVGVSVHRSRSGKGFNAQFSGTITPAQDGARVGIERLTGSGWKSVAGTSAHNAGPSQSRYSVRVHLVAGAYFRVIVIPLNTGAMSTGYSGSVLVHALR
jgi:hypothetical protein